MPDEPLTKVTLNLYTKDVEFLSRRFEYGWSVAIRDEVRKMCNRLRKGETNEHNG
jgi:hypothetical protein